MKIIPSNINVYKTRFLISAIKCLLIMVSLLYGSSSFAASAEPDGFEAGVVAVRQGNYVAAREIFGNVLATTDEDREMTLSKAYLLAINDNHPAKIHAAVVAVIRAESSKKDPIFQVMEARLHLLGLHPESNAAVGLKLIKAAAVEDSGYAYYTWGLHLEGKFGGPKDVKQAGSKYQEANNFGFKEALSRIGAIRRELDRMDATTGGWGDGASTWDGVLQR